VIIGLDSLSPPPTRRTRSNRRPPTAPPTAPRSDEFAPPQRRHGGRLSAPARPWPPPTPLQVRILPPHLLLALGGRRGFVLLATPRGQQISGGRRRSLPMFFPQRNVACSVTLHCNAAYVFSCDEISRCEGFLISEAFVPFLSVP
jgi:hypothetical protein